MKKMEEETGTVIHSSNCAKIQIVLSLISFDVTALDNRGQERWRRNEK
jgi:hypothetical protein